MCVDVFVVLVLISLNKVLDVVLRTWRIAFYPDYFATVGTMPFCGYRFFTLPWSYFRGIGVVSERIWYTFDISTGK